MNVVEVRYVFRNLTLTVAETRELEKINVKAVEWGLNSWNMRTIFLFFIAYPIILLFWGDYLLQFPKLVSSFSMEQKGKAAEPDYVFGESKAWCEAIAEEMTVMGIKKFTMRSKGKLVAESLPNE